MDCFGQLVYGLRNQANWFAAFGQQKFEKRVIVLNYTTWGKTKSQKVSKCLYLVAR